MNRQSNFKIINLYTHIIIIGFDYINYIICALYMYVYVNTVNKLIPVLITFVKNHDPNRHHFKNIKHKKRGKY